MINKNNKIIDDIEYHLNMRITLLCFLVVLYKTSMSSAFYTLDLFANISNLKEDIEITKQNIKKTQNETNKQTNKNRLSG